MFDWIDKTFRKDDSPPPDPEGPDADPIAGQTGFVGGTHVISNLGWRPVETLSPGDKVLSFDHGMQPVAAIRRDTLAVTDILPAGAPRPLLVPTGALDNRKPIWLMPEHGVLLHCDTARDIVEAPFAVVPARALAGFRGIRAAVPARGLQVTTLSFDRDEVVFVEGGMLSLCPRSRDGAPQAPAANTDGSPYRMQSYLAAHYLMRVLIEAEEAGELTCTGPDFATLFAEPPTPVRPVRVPGTAQRSRAPRETPSDLAPRGLRPSHPTLSTDAPRTPRPQRPTRSPIG